MDDLSPVPTEYSVLFAATALTRFALREPTGYDPPSRNPNGGDSMDLTRLILGVFRAFILRHTALAAENVALRQQLAVLGRSVSAPSTWASKRSSSRIARPGKAHTSSG